MSISIRSILQLGQVVGAYFHSVLYEVEVLSPTPLVDPPADLDRYKYFDKVMQDLSHGQTEERIFYQTLSLIKDHMLELLFHPEAVHIFRMNAIIKLFDTVIATLDKILSECQGTQPVESLRGLEGFTKSIKRLALEYYQGCVNAKIAVLPLNYSPGKDPLAMNSTNYPEMSSPPNPVGTIPPSPVGTAPLSPIGTVPSPGRSSPIRVAPEFIPTSLSPERDPIRTSQDRPMRTSQDRIRTSQDRAPVKAPTRTFSQEKTPISVMTRPKSTPLSRSSSPVVKAPLNASADSTTRQYALPIQQHRTKRERHEPPQNMTMLWYRQHNYTDFFIGRPISFLQGHLAARRCYVVKITDSAVTCRFSDGSHNLVKTNIPLTWYERN